MQNEAYEEHGFTKEELMGFIKVCRKPMNLQGKHKRMADKFFGTGDPKPGGGGYGGGFGGGGG